jgi:CubicO group peptidase (beta-lactamase class C family)
MKHRPAKSVCFIILIGFLIALQSGWAQTAAPLKTDVAKEKLVSELERVVPELMKKGNIPGLSIAVLRDGQLLWTKGFGVKSTKTNEPVTEDTIFEAASLTKPFFAYAAMKMIESGELSLDRPLYEYLPREKIEQGLEHSLEQLKKGAEEKLKELAKKQ